ncbi:hypothetical protein N6L26_06140 [Qipengyuania sp. SS22]|uniref:hypothetical protein n=1 Tax=Qipengyuania sp. SS22 TaxID=2979461 RepID=UPI0021E596BA|nr:hypothetical protein [Qipengyuania sp. SS22]UYH56130.1 hypothetical protein N6L26_06140 [Qipengyuania sp. SS22]
MTRTALSLLSTLTLAFGGCSPADAPAGEDAPALASDPASPDDCLLLVWSSQEERHAQFDRTHDFVDGGAISCATGTSASQFDAAIAALRDAASSGNKRRMLEEIGLPLLYIDAAGNRREIEDRGEVEAVFDEIFDPAMIALLQRLDLSQMSVAKDQGGFFTLGAVWLVVDRDGGRPRLMTVNRQALDEALEIARDQAERNQGDRVPFD